MDNTASTLTRLHAARLLIISVRQPDTRGLEAPARAIRIISAWTRNSDHGDEDGKLKNYNIVRNIINNNNNNFGGRERMTLESTFTVVGTLLVCMFSYFCLERMTLEL